VQQCVRALSVNRVRDEAPALECLKLLCVILFTGTSAVANYGTEVIEIHSSKI
jgi:hypothetical protein